MSAHAESVILAFKADAAISKGMAVKIGSDRDHVAKGAAATDKLIGIAMNTVTDAEDRVEVALDGGAKGLLVGSVSAGDLLTCDSTGKLVATTTANNRVVGIALEDGVAADLIAMQVGISNV